MKKTTLEFNKDLNSFYRTLKESIILYFIAVALITGASFSTGLMETIYVWLAVLCTSVYTVYFGFAIVKFFFLSENYEGTGMNYFTDLWIKTVINDSKKLINSFKK